MVQTADNNPAPRALPPGPRLPRLIQTAGFLVGGVRFLESCRRRYGDVVTLSTLFDSPFVMVFDPGLVKELFQGSNEQLHAGEANALLGRPSLLIPQIANYLGLFLLAMALVLVSLNAMRVGLLTRFLGYLGIIGGVLTIIPLVPIPIVEAYWLLALAYLLSGRWPSGVPPAWSSGRAEPWPPRQPAGAARGQAAGRGARGGRVKPAPTPAPETVGAAARTPANPRSSTAKRKRKRKR